MNKIFVIIRRPADEGRVRASMPTCVAQTNGRPSDTRLALLSVLSRRVGERRLIILLNIARNGEYIYIYTIRGESRDARTRASDHDIVLRKIECRTARANRLRLREYHAILPHRGEQIPTITGNRDNRRSNTILSIYNYSLIRTPVLTLGDCFLQQVPLLITRRPRVLVRASLR